MRRPATALAAVLSAAALSACGTGLQAQVYQPRDAAQGTNATAGDLELRNLGVETGSLAPADGGDTAGGTANAVAVITGVIVNKGTEDDALVNATSDAAGSVQLLTPNGDRVLAIPAGGSTGSDWALRLDGLAAPLTPGTYLTVTLQFGRAPRTTLSLPVRGGDNGLSTRKPLQDPYGGGE